MGQDAENFSCSVSSFASEVQPSVINYSTTVLLVSTGACYLSLPTFSPFENLLINVEIHQRAQLSFR